MRHMYTHLDILVNTELYLQNCHRSVVTEEHKSQLETIQLVSWVKLFMTYIFFSFVYIGLTHVGVVNMGTITGC